MAKGVIFLKEAVSMFKWKEVAVVDCSLRIDWK